MWRVGSSSRHHPSFATMSRKAKSAPQLTLEAFAEKARKTAETPPRISVVDAIAIAKGCSTNYAAQLFQRLVAEDRVPPCAEVSQNLVTANCSDQEPVDTGSQHHGGNRKDVVVASVEEMVQILWALPGQSAFRRHCSLICVRYLGGDETLVGEICRNRTAQECLARESPAHPARIFGEAVEATRDLKRGREHEDVPVQLQAVVDAASERVLQEMRRTHVWSFSKGGGEECELFRVGRVVGGSELVELDRNEHLLKIVDFLKERFSKSIWEEYGRKFKSIFAIELKRAKLAQCRDEGLPPVVVHNQGEYRIAYTEADNDLMIYVLKACRARFEGIAGKGMMLKMHPKNAQRSVWDLLRSNHDSGVAGSSTTRSPDSAGRVVLPARSIADLPAGWRCGAKRGHADIDAQHGNLETEAFSTSPAAVASPSAAWSAESCASTMLHHSAVPEAPANLRLRAKRGDADIAVMS